ncbi:MAG: NADH:ubiquinone reductase (Na(+)-transporting) subunit C [Muribaculaceae bacterium]|nr:NADH:ubiquinone reductase (Na(+)-transporting) subunit C [Muribaculaceae bacterium]
MNKNSNVYTIIYSIVLVVVVGVVLSVVYQALRPKQLENIANDTKKQILASAHISPEKDETVASLFDSHIVSSYLVNFTGQRVDNDINPFDINMALEIKKPADQRLLPVYECSTNDGMKFIVPVYGAGLWGPIWGYVAFDSNGDTIYGAYFSHEGETPGLGAEIEKPAFQNQFEGKNIFGSDGQFTSIAVVKTGKEPQGKAWVHAVSGGTITSQGVQKMLYDSLEPYSAFFSNLADGQSIVQDEGNNNIAPEGFQGDEDKAKGLELQPQEL